MGVRGDTRTPCQQAMRMNREERRSLPHGAWPCETLFHDDLMSDAPSGREKADAVLVGKRLYLGVLFEIRRAGVLYIVVQADDDLLCIMNPRGSHRPELV